MSPTERIMAAIRARLARPMTEIEERNAERWARGETPVLLLADFAFGWRDRDRMAEE